MLDLYVGLVFRAVLPLLLLTSTTGAITCALLLRRRRFREAANGGALTLIRPFAQQAAVCRLSTALGDQESLSQMNSGKAAEKALKSSSGSNEVNNNNHHHNNNCNNNRNKNGNKTNSNNNEFTSKQSEPVEEQRSRANTWTAIKFTKSAPVDGTPAEAPHAHRASEGQKPELKVTAASPPVSPNSASIVPPTFQQRSISVSDRQAGELEKISSGAEANTSQSRPLTLIANAIGSRARHTAVAVRCAHRESLQRSSKGEFQKRQGQNDGEEVRSNMLKGAASPPQNNAREVMSQAVSGPECGRLISPMSPNSPVGCADNGGRPREPTSPGSLHGAEVLMSSGSTGSVLTSVSLSNLRALCFSNAAQNGAQRPHSPPGAPSNTQVLVPQQQASRLHRRNSVNIVQITSILLLKNALYLFFYSLCISLDLYLAAKRQDLSGLFPSCD